MPPEVDDETWLRMGWHARQEWLRASDLACRNMREEIVVLQRRLYRVMRSELDELRAEVETVMVQGPGRWTDSEIRAAHAAYCRGERSPYVIAGERRYQQASRRRRRAGR